MSTIDINTLLKEKSGDFKFELLSGSGGLGRKITVSGINRLGLTLIGFLSISHTRRMRADYRNK
jgi:serine kinase of HPr protein (carbohydrate metabolism regulator)